MIHELPSTSLIFLHSTTHIHTRLPITFFSILYSMCSLFRFIKYLEAARRHWSNINAYVRLSFLHKKYAFWIYFYLFLCTVRSCQKIYKFFSFGIFGTHKKEAIKKIIGTLQTRSVLRLFSHPLFLPPVSFIVMSLKCTFYPFFPSFSILFAPVFHCWNYLGLSVLYTNCYLLNIHNSEWIWNEQQQRRRFSNWPYMN